MDDILAIRRNDDSKAKNASSLNYDHKISYANLTCISHVGRSCNRVTQNCDRSRRNLFNSSRDVARRAGDSLSS